MLPDEMIVYEPHHVAYGRLGNKWYRVLANYGGKEVALSPMAVPWQEVKHEFCKRGCKKLHYVQQNHRMVRVLGDYEIDEPFEEQIFAPPKTYSKSRLVAATILSFLAGLVVTNFWLTPSAPLPQLRASLLPKTGGLYRTADGWWKVQEVFPKEQLQTPQSQALYQKYTKSGYTIVPVNYMLPEENLEKTAFLVLHPSHPPGGAMLQKGNTKFPSMPKGLKSSPAVRPSSGPPKAQKL